MPTASEVAVRAATTSLAPSQSFTVRVRAPGAGWQPVDAFRALVDLDTKSTAAFSTFDSNGPVEVEVTSEATRMRTVAVRPASLGITPAIDAEGRVATFLLPRPHDLSFEINGDRLHNLHLFVSPVERDVPKAGAPRVIYFGPGVHRIPGNHVLRIPSHTTVYLAGGAVVEGGLWINRATDVVVRGHGILNPSAVFGDSEEESVRVTGSTDVAIRDLTIIGSQELGFDIVSSNRVTLARVREINASRWSDGINMKASRNVLVDGAFLRTSDDSVAVYASTPWGGSGDTRNVVVRNSTLWADVAHPINVGTHGDPTDNDVIEQLAFQNIDVLEHDEELAMYQGTMAVNAGDRVTVRDVRFDDVRIEDFRRGQLVNVRVFLNPSYNKEPGTAVDRVFFRNESTTARATSRRRSTGTTPTARWTASPSRTCGATGTSFWPPQPATSTWVSLRRTSSFARSPRRERGTTRAGPSATPVGGLTPPASKPSDATGIRRERRAAAPPSTSTAARHVSTATCLRPRESSTSGWTGSTARRWIRTLRRAGRSRCGLTRASSRAAGTRSSSAAVARGISSRQGGRSG
jgi:hypothetical protein